VGGYFTADTFKQVTHIRAATGQRRAGGRLRKTASELARAVRGLVVTGGLAACDTAAVGLAGDRHLGAGRTDSDGGVKGSYLDQETILGCGPRPTGDVVGWEAVWTRFRPRVVQARVARGVLSTD
jgi:hypothetical protein